jgi:hypothetical protein
MSSGLPPVARGRLVREEKVSDVASGVAGVQTSVAIVPRGRWPNLLEGLRSSHSEYDLDLHTE